MEKKPSPLIEKPTSATAAPRPTTAALLRARLAEPGGVSMTELMLLTGWQAHIIAGKMLPAPDPVLIRTLAQSHGWAKSLRARTMLTDIAAATGHSEPTSAAASRWHSWPPSSNPQSSTGANPLTSPFPGFCAMALRSTGPSKRSSSGGTDVGNGAASASAALTTCGTCNQSEIAPSLFFPFLSLFA